MPHFHTLRDACLEVKDNLATVITSSDDFGRPDPSDNLTLLLFAMSNFPENATSFRCPAFLNMLIRISDFPEFFKAIPGRVTSLSLGFNQLLPQNDEELTAICNLYKSIPAQIRTLDIRYTGYDTLSEEYRIKIRSSIPQAVLQVNDGVRPAAEAARGLSSAGTGRLVMFKPAETAPPATSTATPVAAPVADQERKNPGPA